MQKSPAATPPVKTSCSLRRHGKQADLCGYLALGAYHRPSRENKSMQELDLAKDFPEESLLPWQCFWEQLCLSHSPASGMQLKRQWVTSWTETRTPAELTSSQMVMLLLLPGPNWVAADSKESLLIVLMPDHGAKSSRELAENSNAQAMKIRLSGNFQSSPMGLWLTSHHFSMRGKTGYTGLNYWCACWPVFLREIQDTFHPGVASACIELCGVGGWGNRSCPDQEQGTAPGQSCQANLSRGKPIL